MLLLFSKNYVYYPEIIHGLGLTETQLGILYSSHHPIAIVIQGWNLIPISR